MEDVRRFCEMVKGELDKIAEKGLTTANLDTAYKLADIYKDMKNVEYWDIKGEYYESQMDGGYSQNDGYGRDGDYSRDGRGRDGYSARGRKRDSRGRYSRDGGGYARDGGYSYGSTEAHSRYLDSKHAFRQSGGNSDCKRRLMETLDEYMEDFTEQMEEMLRDSDCAEEKETIKRYIGKLKNLS